MAEPGSEPNPSSSRETESRASDSPGDAFASAAHRLAEMKEFAATYISAKADAAKLSIRKLIIAIALGIIGLLATIAILVCSIVQLLIGLGGAIGAAFDPPKPWLGNLIVGAGILLVATLMIFFIVRGVSRKQRAKTVEKYEAKHLEQRRRFGRDVTGDVRGDVTGDINRQTN